MTTTMDDIQESLYRWRLVHAGPRLEHCLFVDDVSGRLAVVDNSGVLPTTCEDGVLWLPLDQIPVIASSKHVRLSVVRERRPQHEAFTQVHLGLARAAGFRVFSFHNQLVEVRDEK